MFGGGRHQIFWSQDDQQFCWYCPGGIVGNIGHASWSEWDGVWRYRKLSENGSVSGMTALNGTGVARKGTDTSSHL